MELVQVLAIFRDGSSWNYDSNGKFKQDSGIKLKV
jgi:hypothetical protein